MASNNGLLVIMSAPSGCGKDTVFKELVKKRDDVVESVSATTRKPREGEVDGVNYFFLTKDKFEKMIKNNGFLEYANYNGNYYGTPVKGVQKAIEEGKVCFLIIEVQGAQKVMKMFPDNCVSIFLLPPSLDVLEQRLRKRDSDGEEMIKQRLDIANIEMSYKDKYTYQIVNDDIDVCVNDIDKIISQELDERKSINKRRNLLWLHAKKVKKEL